MIWYYWLLIVSAVICFVSLSIHAYRLIRNGNPGEYSRKRGDTGKSVRYAFTGAMSPKKKESAFLYLPTYAAGLLYHLGTFLSFFAFILILVGFSWQGIPGYITSAILFLTGTSGFFILVKRITKKQLRTLSNADDYISNFLVTIFQLMTAITIIRPGIEAIYFLVASLLLLYLPLGKLRHIVYFFAARYHLGFFYGWRGVWPPKQG